MSTSYAKQMAQWRKRRERMIALRDKGETMERIGQLVGCSKQRVHQILGGRKLK